MKAINYIALHLDGDELKLAHIQGNRNKFKILKTESLSHDVKQLDNWTQNNSYTFVTGMDAWDLFLREFSFNLRFKREILSILPFQVESQFPYPLEQLILAPIFHKKKEAVTVVSLFALTEQQLTQHLHSFQGRGIDPDIVSVVPNALFRFASHFFKEHSSLIVYHLGTEKSCYIALSDGKILLSQTQNFGSRSSDREGFEKDLERFCSYVRRKTPLITQLLLCGEKVDQLPFFTKTLSPHFSIIESSEKYAIPLGLCLDALAQDQKSVQFRCGPFLPEKKKKKRKRRIKTYLIAAASLFLLTFVSGQIFLQSKENKISSALKSVHVSKAGSLEDQLSDFAIFLAKNKTPASFTLTVPKVSDVLEWVGGHPKLQMQNEELQIEHLRYQLVKYPVLDSPLTPYEARVEIDFFSSSPRFAREFHDSLLKGDPFINSKREIQWTSSQDHYQTSFYLNPLKLKKTQ